jgi:DNA transposition AAA+ family ATPase
LPWANRTKTPGRVVDLERDRLTFEFFETLKSDHDVGEIQRCGKPRRGGFAAM